MSVITFFDLINEEVLLSPEKVLFFKSYDKSITAFLSDCRQVTFTFHISALECSLPVSFIRISDNIIIHKFHIKESMTYDPKHIIIVMNDVQNTSFIVSSHYAEKVRLNLDLPD